MPLLDAFVMEPLLVNEPIIDSLCLEAGCLEVFLANSEEAGSGTACDPYGVTNATDFDNLMNSFPPNSTIHLAAGQYETRGYAIGVTTKGWMPKRGFRLVGAGMGATVLKLVELGDSGKQYFAVGGEDDLMVDGLEVRDLTNRLQSGRTIVLSGCGRRNQGVWQPHPHP